MTNFFLGMLAGGIIACVATIAAARHPEVQSRLGLVPPAQAAKAPAPVVAPRCPPPPPQAAPTARVGNPEMLFARGRFWNVAP
ncbi:hypothetical protein [Methylobacterium organophilum]|uniref:Uncharacterized protein n=1 Tax=Methylobacterium organophilum TaxID=410 RepID=A0ABQ4TC64_METOR|nr:hypothetical protein [Methylobacterium organophilum]GJE28823.1 hypothetical protein LKMONMHP_3697 [Methylobacterium organophilum]